MEQSKIQPSVTLYSLNR